MTERAAVPAVWPPWPRWRWAAARPTRCGSGRVPRAASPRAAQEVAAGKGVWDATAVHEISIEVDEAAVAAMIETYQETSEKEWIEATVTIDGDTFEQVGLRLKGNSSLRGVSDDAEAQDLPWLIRLDKFVDGQEVEGWSEFIVRSNGSETALNEAVALDLLAEAGLASEHAIATSFTFNGSDATLRLVLQGLDEEWEAENFSTAGLLYKAEAGGDWSYRGEDPDSYTDVFDQETGDDDLTPLIEFLDFINNSTDEEFAAELPERLDIESFARYLAFEELVDNFDDIDGPGNNSYLRYDAESGGFTVVAWDHNLAFGGAPGGGGFTRGEGGERPEGMPRRGCRPISRPACRPSCRRGCRPTCRGDADASGRRATRRRWPGWDGRRVEHPRRALHRGRGVGRPRRAGQGRPHRGAVRQRLRGAGPRRVDDGADRAGVGPGRCGDRDERGRRDPGEAQLTGGNSFIAWSAIFFIM